jgi:hypothetical protein
MALVTPALAVTLKEQFGEIENHFQAPLTISPINSNVIESGRQKCWVFVR